MPVFAKDARSSDLNLTVFRDAQLYVVESTSRRVGAASMQGIHREDRGCLRQTVSLKVPDTHTLPSRSDLDRNRSPSGDHEVQMTSQLRVDLPEQCPAQRKGHDLGKLRGRC